MVSASAGPDASITERAADRCDALRPVTATWTPCATSARAIARPMPREPPVTNATFPSSGCLIRQLSASASGLSMACWMVAKARADCQIDNNSSGMSAIVILGAGELGGSLAHVLARQDLVSDVHLVDDAGSVAEGKALDIAQSAPIEAFATRVSGSTQLAQAAGADLIFVADRFKSGEWQDDAGLQLLRQVAQFASRRVIVCAGAAHRLLVEQAVRELKLPRNAVLGSAPEALASAIRSLTAVETGTSASDVALTVLGIPPSGIVVPWDESSIGGFSAINVLDEVTRRRLSARIA